MTNFLTEIIGEYGEVKSSMWRFTFGDALDVAAFCDSRLSGGLTYLGPRRVTLNRGVAAQPAE